MLQGLTSKISGTVSGLTGTVSGLTGMLRELAHRKLQATGNEHPLVQKALEIANTVNDILGKPIHGAEEESAASMQTASQAAAKVREQAPVLVYFDGKDHRTKTKVEELLRGHGIVFQIQDVTNDEAERSWIITAAKQEEFPIVVIAGTPVGGFAELTQLDVQGELKRRVFAPLPQ
jgi:glutaredoxin